MERQLSLDTYLVDSYRTRCFKEGVAPKAWLENALLKIPNNLKCLSLSLRAPVSAPELDLTESEISGLIDSMLSCKEESQTSRCSVSLTTIGRKTTSKSGIPRTAPSRPPQKRVPLAALELDGEGVTINVVKEMVFWSLDWSHECILRDLIISSSQITDFLPCMAICGPLRRSLKCLVIKNCPEFSISCEFSWALFFGTSSLEEITIVDCGLSVRHLSLLCQILCDNEKPCFDLKVLRLGVHEGEYFSDLEFVNVKRCLTRLSSLRYFEINGLNNDQKLQLMEEWSKIKGSSSRDWTELSGVKLTMAGGQKPKERFPDPVSFEEMSALRPFSDRPFDAFAQTKSSRFATGLNFARSTSSQRPRCTERKPILRRSNPKSKSSVPLKQAEVPSVSIGDALWNRFKPPPIPAVRLSGSTSSLFATERKKSRSRVSERGSAGLNFNFRTTKPLEYYFSSAGNEVDDGYTSENELDQAPDDRSTTFQRTLSPRSERRFTSPDRRRRPGLRLLDGDMALSGESSVDSDDEKMYGPPPGGRKVNLGDGNRGDLMGYISDGMVRPDDEIIYTTSASDDEIERDLEVLCRGVYRQVSLCTDSDSDGDNDEETMKKSVNKRPKRACTSVPEARKSLRRRLNQSTLEKELSMLKPFHYDKNRERFKPGKFFDCLDDSELGDGIALRSGKRV